MGLSMILKITRHCNLKRLMHELYLGEADKFTLVMDEGFRNKMDEPGREELADWLQVYDAKDSSPAAKAGAVQHMEELLYHVELPVYICIADMAEGLRFDAMDWVDYGRLDEDWRVYDACQDIQKARESGRSVIINQTVRYEEDKVKEE